MNIIYYLVEKAYNIFSYFFDSDNTFFDPTMLTEAQKKNYKYLRNNINNQVSVEIKKRINQASGIPEPYMSLMIKLSNISVVLDVMRTIGIGFNDEEEGNLIDDYKSIHVFRRNFEVSVINRAIQYLLKGKEITKEKDIFYYSDLLSVNESVYNAFDSFSGLDSQPEKDREWIQETINTIDEVYSRAKSLCLEHSHQDCVSLLEMAMDPTKILRETYVDEGSDHDIEDEEDFNEYG